jgi:hypothetical protein
MAKQLYFSILALLSLCVCGRADPWEKTRTFWRDRLEKMQESGFTEKEASVWYSLAECDSEYEVHVAYKRPTSVSLRFVRHGKERCALDAHVYSVFVIRGNLLYFADFDPESEGCSLVAYDLSRGKELWEKELNAVPGAVVSGPYHNRVNLKVGPSALVVTGRETPGDYVEAILWGVGERLAHKVFSREDGASPEGRTRLKRTSTEDGGDHEE